MITCRDSALTAIFKEKSSKQNGDIKDEDIYYQFWNLKAACEILSFALKKGITELNIKI